MILNKRNVECVVLKQRTEAELKEVQVLYRLGLVSGCETVN